jgi:hypothetical protein
MIRGLPGEYLALYTYLENRYADAVVLTFREIEDLLGFALPDEARVRHEWWANDNLDTVKANYSQSWLRARRAAKPNLAAGTVIFERGVERRQLEGIEWRARLADQG